MLKNLSEASRRYLLLVACAFLFFANFLLDADFGKFRPDYFEAHSLGMRHLHRHAPFQELVRTIPNSASGVLPLWLYGFVDGLAAHQMVSLGVFFSLLVLIALKRRLDAFAVHYLAALLLSPMIVSSVTWALPEMFALWLVLVVFALPDRLAPLSIGLAALVPWGRQTFVTHIGNRFFFLTKGGVPRFLLEGFASACGLFVLYRIWDGLVPPKLAKVHLSPSLKSFTLAMTVFSLYFTYDNLQRIRAHPLRGWRLPVAFAAAGVLVATNLAAPSLHGGGYLFSRLEGWSLPMAAVIECGLLTLFFFASDLRLIVWTVISSASFATTNYLFLKYIDFYVFAFLGYGLTRLTPAVRCTFDQYARSVFVFECFSLPIAYIFYVGLK
jgi:hypothetical protein